MVAICDDHDFVGDNRCGADCSDAPRRAARAAFVAGFKPVQTGGNVYHVRHLGEIDRVMLEERYLMVASSTTFHAFGDQSWEKNPPAFERMRSLMRGRLGALIVSGDTYGNPVYDESEVIEIVTSGVARRRRTFGCLRQNYGVLECSDDALSVDLRSLKVGIRFRFTISRGRWRLP